MASMVDVLKPLAVTSRSTGLQRSDFVVPFTIGRHVSAQMSPDPSPDRSVSNHSAVGIGNIASDVPRLLPWEYPGVYTK
jgi:hypothetical protein